MSELLIYKTLLVVLAFSCGAFVFLLEKYKKIMIQYVKDESVNTAIIEALTNKVATETHVPVLGLMHYDDNGICEKVIIEMVERF